METTGTPNVNFPLHLRLANRLGKGIDRFGPRLGQFDPKTLLEAAKRRAGLSDWGEDYAEFRIGLERLLQSAREDAGLSFIGRLAFREYVIRALVHRLQFVAESRRHPEALEAPPRAPLIIVGLPRTGTTFLQRLLSQDPDALSLPLWLLMSPMPAPTQAEWDGGGGDRLIRAERTLRLSPTRYSSIASRHAVSAELPEECQVLTAGSFLSPVFITAWQVQGFIEWLLEQDVRPAYRYLRQALSLLQYNLRQSHWLLKDPWHLLYLEELLEVFPDARIVYTHRDPGKALASAISHNITSHEIFAEELFPERSVRLIAHFFRMSVRRGREARARVKNPVQFLDLRYSDLVADPIGGAQRIYSHFDIPWRPHCEARLRAYVGEHPRNKHGRHQYSLEQFGLSADEVASWFEEEEK